VVASALWSATFIRVGFFRLYLDKKYTCLLVGGGCTVVLKVQLCRRWCRHFFCGVFGGRKNYRSFVNRERMLMDIKSLVGIMLESLKNTFST
jgi:hypothetical protein